MGDTLTCDFQIASEKKPFYWWPLIIESLGSHQLHFKEPEQPESVGFYYYISKSDGSDTDFVKASFREMWDEIVLDTQFFSYPKAQQEEPA